MSARAAMPWRNSSGKVANDASETPNARNPFHVKPTVTHLESTTFDPTTAAVPTLSSRPVSHVRAMEPLLNERNSYRAARAGGLDIKKCWMSSNSSEAGPPASGKTPAAPRACETDTNLSLDKQHVKLLHQVQHVSK